MARVALVDPQNAPAEVQELYEHRLAGRPGNVHKAMAHQPRALTAFLAFYASVGRSLDRRLYELVYTRASYLNGCQYCLQHHLQSSKKVGLTDADWQGIKDPANAPFNASEKLVLTYVEKLTLKPGAIGDADVAELKKVFTDAQVVDLHLLVGLANLTNRFTHPLGLELEFQPLPV